MLDEEHVAFGASCPEAGWLFFWENGRRPHPDSVTDRFNHLVNRAGARRIRLHDVRHTYAMLARDSRVEPKIVSDRIGHSKSDLTFQVYTHCSTELDKPVADLIGDTIAAAVSDVRTWFDRHNGISELII